MEKFKKSGGGKPLWIDKERGKVSKDKNNADNLPAIFFIPPWLIEADFVFLGQKDMSKFILGKKQEMTQRFRPDGTIVPVTKIYAEPCIVTQVKTHSRDGYSAVQIGAGKAKHVSRPLSGHLHGKPLKNLAEFRIEEEKEGSFAPGDIISASVFSAGDSVSLTGVSKGKGFQGVVKRHHFAGSPKTHGHKDQLRMPGSSGAGGVQHVFRGKRMPGRMGQDMVTITNIEIIEVEPQKNFIYVKGAVPGARNSPVWMECEGEMKLEKSPEPKSIKIEKQV